MDTSPSALRRVLIERARAAREDAEARRAVAVDAARDVCRSLVARGLAREAWLVGSAAWGGFGERSDLDVVVRGLDPTTATELADELARVTRHAVDLLRYEDVAESLQQRATADGLRLA